VSLNSQDVLEAMDGIALLIDPALIIRQIGSSHWEDFWKDNGGNPDPVSVVGRDITEFFSEGQVRDVYRKLFLDVARSARRAVKINYRCDSPVLRRAMRLTVTAVPTAAKPEYLLYQSTTLDVEQRPAIPLFSAPTGTSGSDVVKVCAVCAKVQWPTGGSAAGTEWIEPQDYYRRGGADAVLLSHGFCGPCQEVLMSEEE
jgi:hypothetical protein